MSEQVIVNIVRPEVGIEYRPQSHEAELGDQLAACELAFHTLAHHVRELRQALRLPVPTEVETVIRSDAGRRGL